MSSKRDELNQYFGVSFEVAHDILSQLVGNASNRIDAERAKAEPDAAAIGLWETRRTEWAKRLRSLRPDDTAGVQAVLDEDGAFLRSLRHDRE